MTTRLSSRALNRALLARQLLLARDARPVADMVEHLLGMQAQNPEDPYYALWSRLEGFQPTELSTLIASKQAVRCWPMRRTVHLLTAGDAKVLLPLTTSVGERSLQSGFGRQLVGLDRAEVAALGRKLLEERPRIRAELIPALQERWPDHDPTALSYAAVHPLPLVQLPPRGLWGENGKAVLTTAESWLGEPLAADPSPDEVFLRYVAAFGPASNADFRTWSGLTGVREVTDRLRPRLRTLQDENGRRLFDLLDAPLPDPDTPAPPRFLPEFDNVFLSHEDRSRIIGPHVKVGDITVYHRVQKLLIDGLVEAEWRVTAEDGTSTLTVRPYRPLSGAEESAVAAEGAALLTFVAPDDSHDIHFMAPGGTLGTRTRP